MMTIQKSLFDNQTIIIQMISSGIPLKKILSFIMNNIENSCDSISLYGAIMLYNPCLKQLGETVSSSLPTNFTNSIEPADVSPYGGSCGTAAFLKQPVTVSDIENNPLCEKYRHSAIVHGLRACYSTPLLSSKKELLGTMTFYNAVVGKPDEKTVKLINFYSKLASLAIEVSKSNAVTPLYSFEIDQRTELIPMISTRSKNTPNV
ncbi:MAG: GAF domain-containing protein [Solibacillus sp.]